MAYYAYKSVVYSLPNEYTEERFKENHGRECDFGTDYDGDLWLATADYITDLLKEIDELKGKLSNVS